MERVADRARVAEQGDETPREIPVVRQRPQRRAVAVHDDRLALAHPAQRRPAPVQGDQGRVVGVRGAHDRGREAFFPVRPDQQVLAGDLVPGVRQERVAQRRGLQDRQAGGRCLVGGGGADEHVLPGAAAEGIDVGLHVPGGERDPVHDRVELTVPEQLADLVRIPGVPVQHPRRGRERAGPGLPPGDHRQVDALVHRQPGTRRADHAGTAEEKDPQAAHPASLAPGTPDRLRAENGGRHGHRRSPRQPSDRAPQLARVGRGSPRGPGRGSGRSGRWRPAGCPRAVAPPGHLEQRAAER